MAGHDCIVRRERVVSGLIPMAGEGAADDAERLAGAGPAATLAQWVEVHRLAVAGRETTIARTVGSKVGWAWLRTSRFTDTITLAQATLTLGPDATALYQLGWAQQATGHPTQALTSYQQALHLCRDTGDRAGEAVTLNNIGLVYAGLGDRQQALDFYQQALPITREVGNRTGEATTRYNIAMIHRADGDFDLAIGELEQVVELGRQTNHPDLASDIAKLEQVRGEWTSARDGA